MSTPAKIWIPIVLLYALFFGWYTSFGGPLTDEEIATYTAMLRENGDGADIDQWIQFMESDTGDDFVMQNAVDFLPTPRPIEGVEPGDTSAEVMAKYAEPFLGRALRSAAHPVLAGSVTSDPIDMWGIDAKGWEQGALVRYRSRRDLMEMATAISEGPDAGIHDFKVAAIEKTIAFPLDPWFHLGDPRLVLGLALAVVGLSLQLALGRGNASSA